MKYLDQYYIEKWGINSYVEHRLEHWAKWYKQNEYSHLGYPKESLEFRHLNSGGVIHTSRRPKPLSCNPAAEEIERIIGILMRVDEKAAKAICQEYLYNKDQIIKAREMGISLSQFKVHVAYARYWLRGWFNAHLANKLSNID